MESKRELGSAPSARLEIRTLRGLELVQPEFLLHIQPYWKEKYNLKDSDFPIAMNNFPQLMSLPIYTKLSNAEVKTIINAVREIYEEIV